MGWNDLFTHKRQRCNQWNSSFIPRCIGYVITSIYQNLEPTKCSMEGYTFDDICVCAMASMCHEIYSGKRMSLMVHGVIFVGWWSIPITRPRLQVQCSHPNLVSYDSHYVIKSAWWHVTCFTEGCLCNCTQKKHTYGTSVLAVQLNTGSQYTRRHRLVGIRIPYINPILSSDRLRLIMGFLYLYHDIVDVVQWIYGRNATQNDSHHDGLGLVFRKAIYCIKWL